MTGTRLRHIVLPALALAVALALPSTAAGQASRADGIHHATRLGGTTAFYAPPLTSAASLKQMAARAGMAEDIRKVLRDSGIPQTADAVLAVLAGASSFVPGGACDAATPPDGTIVACDMQPGSNLLWMAYRPTTYRGDRTPGRLDRVRWAGTRPFKALLFRVTNGDKVYTFVLPMECANLSLMSVTDLPREAVSVSVVPVCDPRTGILRATMTTAGRDIGRVQRVSVTIDGQRAGEMSAPSWTFVSDRAGDYEFDATDASGRSYPLSGRTIRQEACPAPPAEVPSPVVTPAVVAPEVQAEPIMSKAGPAFIIDVLGGKERRVRPIDDTDLEYAQCSPLLGLKLGVAKRFANDWEVAGLVGGAISMVGGDDKVRESALFVDVEVNKYVGGGAFIGTGLSFWDLTRSDTFTPAWLIHAAAPVTRNTKHRVYLMLEGRLFLDNIDDVSNNYLVWAGVRINLGR